MLMYGKEASNREQEIDRQYHTIPNQRPKDKHRGNVYNLLFRHGKAKVQLSQNSIRQQVMHITHSADYYGIPLILYHIKPIFIY